MNTDHPLGTQPARIALAGDWHGDTTWARETIAFAARQGCQGVIQLGDFGIWPGVEGKLYLNGVQQALEEFGLWCAFIDGNHEDFWQLNEIPIGDDGLRQVRDRLWHLPRGTRWEWAGKTWLAMGGATSLDRAHRKLGRDWWPEESITGAQFVYVTAGGRADVMLTHDCPANVPIPNLDPSAWSATALAEARAHRQIMLAIAEVVQPSNLWHGHFHVRYQAEVQFAGKPCSVNGLGCNGDEFLKTVAIMDVNG